MKTPLFSLLLMTATAAWAAPVPADGTDLYGGEAFDDHGTLLYRERHEVLYGLGRVKHALTQYSEPGGKLIAELESDFPNGPAVPSYRFRDLRTGKEEGVRIASDALLIAFSRAKLGAPLKSAEILRKPNTVAGQGFHFFTIEMLDELARGKAQAIQFVLPTRGEAYGFGIRPLESRPGELRVALEIDSWVLRIFAPTIEARYRLRDRRLVEYVGLSNLETAPGNQPHVTIRYSHAD